MNILLYEWNTFGQRDLEDTLQDLGHQVDKISYVFTDFEKDEAFESKLSELLLVKKYDFVLSFNFFQVISKVCNTFCIKYIAWVWDSPLINLNSKTIYHPINYIFIFDRTLYTQMKHELKADTVYYLPLAVHVERLDQLVISGEEREAYKSEISFVGSLYEKRSHYNEISGLPDYLKGYFDGIMRAQMKIHGYNFIKEMLTDEIMEELGTYITINPGANYIGDVKDIFADRFLNTKITGIERRSLLGQLSRYFDITVYTDSDTSDLEYVNNKGYIDYYTEMPKVFRCSRINLNFTVRTIKSGIPLRVFDILGAGGFLITNYQEDLGEYFEIGKDLVVYESEEDLIDKVSYYLQHEEERTEIAENGYRKVKQFHTYKIRMKEILRVASGALIPDEPSGLIQEQTSAESGEADQIKRQLNQLVSEGRMEEVKTLYYSFRRRYPVHRLNKELADLDQMLRICSYEAERQQNTLFEQVKDLEEAWKRYDRIRSYIMEFEDSESENDHEFVRYVTTEGISYTAIEFIISEYAVDKVRVLNRVARMFLQAGRNELVLPFLSLSIELEPEENETLYLLALILYQLGEYNMAYEYIDKISIATSEAIELMELILHRISPSASR